LWGEGKGVDGEPGTCLQQQAGFAFSHIATPHEQAVAIA